MSPTADTRARSRRGMTLVELIVGIAIFTVVMSSVFVMFTAISNSVRGSYATMDLFERSRGALLAIENDIQTAFAAPATGDDVFFYGEPHGFTFIGVAPDGRVGRLTYAVHRDTTRLTDPADPAARGVRVTLARPYGEVLDRYIRHAPVGAPDFSVYYAAPSPDALVNFEVEIIYGLLVRLYEQGVDNIRVFPELESRKDRGLLRRAFRRYAVETGPSERFWDLAQGFTRDSPPEHIMSRLRTLEDCHYWIQLVHGPGLPPIQPWNPMSIWSPYDTENLLWFDHRGPAAGVERRPLWDHVVGQEIVLAAYLLDPNTGARISWPDPQLGSIGVPAIDLPPIFTYFVESGAHSTSFNTLFNLDFAPENNFEQLAHQLAMGMDPDITEELRNLTQTNQFYEVGHPLQARLPASFEVVFQVVNPPVTPGAPTELYQFRQRIHIPAGFLRRGRAI